MTLLFTEGFDWVDSADATMLPQGKWAAIGNTSSTFITIEARAGGGNYLGLNNDSSSLIRSRSFGSKSALILGFDFRIEATDAANHIFAEFYDGSQRQLYLRQNVGGTIGVYNGDNQLQATSTEALTINTWYYIEAKITFHATTGTIDVHVNGNSWISETGKDTVDNSGGNQADHFQLLGQDDDFHYDHVYLCDTLGTKNNDFLGPIQIETVVPDGDSAVAWSRSGGTTNAENVDEIGPDDDATYVSSNTATQRDLYDYAALTSGINTVFGVQVNARGRKEDAGNRALTLETKSGASEQSSSNKYIGTEYSTFSGIFETKNGTDDWTATDVNAAQFGIEIAS